MSEQVEKAQARVKALLTELVEAQAELSQVLKAEHGRQHASLGAAYRQRMLELETAQSVVPSAAILFDETPAEPRSDVEEFVKLSPEQKQARFTQFFGFGPPD